MKLDKDFPDDTNVESEASDFYDSHVITSTSPVSNGIFPPSPPLSNGERKNGFKEASQETLDHFDTVQKSKMNSGTNATEIYDRDSILYKLADPENLGVIEKIERMHGKSATEIFAKSTKDVKGTAEECRELMTERLRETLQSVPSTLLHMLTGRVYAGDCGRPSDQKPDWLDMDKLHRGQKFAQDNMFPIFLSEMLTFFAVFSFEDSLKPLIITERSGNPYTAFQRYLSTGLRIRHWYTQDPWVKGTAAQNDFMVVRAKHAAVRRRLEALPNEELDAAAIIQNAWCPTREMLLKDFSETCDAPVIGQCPYTSERNSPDRPKGINQAEMALTQWSFIGLITSFPKHCGANYATDEDLEAFCHLWRVIGYQLGIEDEFNFCRGTLEEIRQRNHDFVETWVKPNLREVTPEWEHMVRCVYSGMSVVLPGLSYEVGLLYLTDIFDLKMPRLYASLSYKDWITYNLMKFSLFYMFKLPGVASFFNNMLNRSLDRAEKFTPEELEAIRINLADYSAGKSETKKDI